MASASTSRYAPRTAMLPAAWLRSSSITTRFAPRPTTAVTISATPATSGGSPMRRIASTTTNPPTASSSTALTTAVSTSARYQPKVRASLPEPRRASSSAASAIAIAATSVSM